MLRFKGSIDKDLLRAGYKTGRPSYLTFMEFQ